MSLSAASKYKGELGAILFFLISFIVCWFSTTTFDTGDSITHFLISKKAWQQPQLLLHHWGKPLFTLLSMPFAQLGFKGIELYNCLIGALCAYFAFLSARRLGMRYPLMVYPLLISAPKFFLGQFSGLTEPTFALCLIAGFYFMLTEHRILALLIISFSPFVRTEGFIIMGIYAVYLLVSKQWKLVPWLLVGLIVYSIIGFPYYQDLLWVFHENPYAGAKAGTNTYGHGTLDHYVIQLMYVLGVPFYVLFGLGCVWFMAEFIRKKEWTDPLGLQSFFLWYGCLLGFIAAHSLFWWLGIFNSFGMVRIMISIVPLAALAAVFGLQQLSSSLQSLMTTSAGKKATLSFYLVVTVYVLVFPFTSNPAAYALEKDFKASDEHQMVKSVLSQKDLLIQQAPFIYYAHPLIAMELPDVSQKKQVVLSSDESLNNFPSGTLIFWDNWFAVRESRLEDSLFHDTRFYQLVDQRRTGANEVKVYLRR